MVKTLCAGRGRHRPHYRRHEDSEECGKVPKILMGYFFLVGEDAEATENPMFVMVDEERDTGMQGWLTIKDLVKEEKMSG